MRALTMSRDCLFARPGFMSVAKIKSRVTTPTTESKIGEIPVSFLIGFSSSTDRVRACINAREKKKYKYEVGFSKIKILLTK